MDRDSFKVLIDAHKLIRDITANDIVNEIVAGLNNDITLQELYEKLKEEETKKKAVLARVSAFVNDMDGERQLKDYCNGLREQTNEISNSIANINCLLTNICNVLESAGHSSIFPKSLVTENKLSCLDAAFKTQGEGVAHAVDLVFLTTTPSITKRMPDGEFRQVLEDFISLRKRLYEQLYEDLSRWYDDPIFNPPTKPKAQVSPVVVVDAPPTSQVVVMESPEPIVEPIHEEQNTVITNQEVAVEEPKRTQEEDKGDDPSSEEREEHMTVTFDDEDEFIIVGSNKDMNKDRRNDGKTLEIVILDSLPKDSAHAITLEQLYVQYREEILNVIDPKRVYPQYDLMSEFTRLFEVLYEGRKHNIQRILVRGRGRPTAKNQKFKYYLKPADKVEKTPTSQKRSKKRRANVIW